MRQKHNAAQSAEDTELETEKAEERAASDRDFFDWMQTLTAVLVVVVLVFTFFFMVISVSGSSMYPTLHDGDIMLVQRIAYTPQAGDIVVLRKESFYDEAIVKRCIAVAGQEVEIDYEENQVYIDGVALEEDYLNFTNEGLGDQYGDDYMVEKNSMVYSDFIVPEGYIFVMGDNRNGSSDSRTAELGMVDTRYVIGKVLAVFFPFDRAQLFS